MRKREKVWLGLFAFIAVLTVWWVRENLLIFRPILEDSTLFFQLIVASTFIAVTRNVIGIKTFGVFGPTIIAFGILRAGLIWGLVIYVDIFLVVMLTSIVLYPLGIASSHRVAILIAVTGVAITVFEVIGELFHVKVLESAILFPVLITSWLADRFVREVREVGWVPPSNRIVGTFFVTILAALIMMWEPLIDLVALNPETWLFIVLINGVIGTKVDFRLSEYVRFGSAIEKGRRNDVLGINKRNRDYVFKHNPANLFSHLSKDRMKATMHQLDIPTPRTYIMVEDKRHLPLAAKMMIRHSSFVIKPSKGLGGEGILVVDRTGKGKASRFHAKGQEFSLDELKAHVTQIIDGGFTSDWSDVAIIEEKVVTDEAISDYFWKGVPDIRVIVFEGFPVMSMTRLPTQESDGAANLHKGAIGMGLRIEDGSGVNPFWPGHGGSIEKHPDTGAVLTTMVVPNWSRLLEIACLAQGASRLGYVGVDIVLDRKGPMVLEVNKRPGLEIQNTNLAGLLARLRFVEERLPENGFKPVSERVELARKWDRKGWR